MRSHSKHLRDQFMAWYQDDMPRLFSYVSYWLPDRAAAEDMTAAICERAFERLAQYDPARGELSAWIFGIARNMLRTQHRARQNKPLVVSLDTLPEISGDAQSPEHAYEEAETFRLVLANLHHLSAQEREVIALRFGAGFSYREIADLMDITVNQTGVVLHRALKKLREALVEEVDA